MINKKILFITIILIGLFAVSAVSAAENITEETGTADEILASENDEIQSTQNDEIMSSGGEKTFADLNETINGNNNPEVSLDYDYKYTDDDSDFIDGIVIKRNVTVNGNNHTIDGNLTARIFKLDENTDYGIVFKNINFINGKADECGAIYGICTAVNCNFTNNQANWGGAMGGGSAVNCTFNNNQAVNAGGAMVSGSAVNCIFINNYADQVCGAMFKGSAVNCTFNSNGAGKTAGAMGEGIADTCICNGNTAGESDPDYYNTTILNPILSVFNYTSAYNSGEKLKFNFTTNSGIVLPTGNITVNISQNGNIIKTITCLSAEGWTVDLPLGTYTAECKATLYDSDVKKVTITVLPYSYNLLNYTINSNQEDTIDLNYEYYFDPLYDSKFTEGIIINRPVTINGNGHAIDAKGQTRIFYVQDANVILKNITFKNGHSDEAGGAIYWYGANGTVTNSYFTNNTANSNGGAIYWIGANGTLTNSYFTNNSATTEDGGAVRWEGDNGKVTNTIFTDNTARYDGGAIFWDSDNGIFTNSYFANNYAGEYGGGIFWYNGTNGIVTNCYFTNNKAGGAAGAIDWYIGDNGIVTNCYFTNNQAGGDAGAIYWGDNNVNGTVTNCNFTNNSATEHGGAILWAEDFGSISLCIFTNNSAPDGGSICSRQWLGMYSDSCIYKTDSDTTSGIENRPPVLTVDNFTSTYKSGEKLTFYLTTNDGNTVINNANITIDIYKNNESFKTCYCLSGEGWVVDLPIGLYNVSYTTEFAEFKPLNRTITIQWGNPNLSVDSAEATYPENVTLTLNYNTNATGKVNITLKGKKQNYAFENRDLNNTITLANINSDEYNVTVAYSGDERFLNATANTTLKVNKATIAIQSVENISIVYGVNNTVTVTGKLNTTKYGDNYSGVITVNIGNQLTNTSNALNGEFSVVINGVKYWNAGEYTITVNGSETANYNSLSEKTAILNITKNQFEIDAAVMGVYENDVKTDQNATVTVLNIPSAEFNTTGVIIVRVVELDKNYTINVPQNSMTVLDIITTPGTYTLTAQYTGNRNYNASNIVTKEFTVTFWNETNLQELIDNSTGNVALEHNYTFTNENATVNVNKSVAINANGHTIDANGSSTALNITADNVSVDNVTVSNVNGTGILSNGTNTTISNVELNNVNGTGILTSGDNATIVNATLNNVTGSGIISRGDNATIDNTEMNSVNGTAITTMGDNTSVCYTALNNVNGTGILSNGTNTTLSNVELNNVDGTGIITSGDNATIVNAILNNVTGSGIISRGDNATIDNTEMNSVNGTAITTMGDNTSVGDTALNNVNGTGIASSGANTNISNTEMNNVNGTGIVSVGETFTISNTRLSNVNGIGIDSDGSNAIIKNNSLENVNGTAIQINGDNAVVNNVTATNITGTLVNVTGDSNTISNINATGNATINIEGKGNIIKNVTGATVIPTISATSAVKGNDVIITATVSATEGNVIVQFQGKKYSVPLTDGKAVITIPNVDAGTYNNVEVNYEGTGLYQSVSTKTSFTSKAAITGNKDGSIDYLSAYSVRIMNAEGNYASGVTVKMTINGKTYDVKTDKDGYAKLTINLKPKTYTITVQYLNVKKTNKIKVKSTIKLVKKTVKVKKTAKKLVLKAKLKWSTGKAIKGKVVKFKFKGKTYKAKTNKKGIAKAKIKKKVIKKLKKGKKYKFTAKYGKEYVKGKVKVKK